jgi:hypothetical protein
MPKCFTVRLDSSEGQKEARMKIVINGAGIAFRNVITRLFGIPLLADFFIGCDLRDDIKIPDYKY